ncbi:MAG: hypothetical protein ACRD9R_17680 [Pyrinomonadaceae bacterium]
MSDYLNHLLTRTFSQARAVQPRLASVFEPPMYAATTPPPLVEPLAEDEASVSAAARLSRSSTDPARTRAANDRRSSHPNVNRPSTAVAPTPDERDAHSLARQSSAARQPAAIRPASSREPRAEHQSPEVFAQPETETLARERRASSDSVISSADEKRFVARAASEIANQPQLEAHLKRILDERANMSDTLRAERHDAPAFDSRGASGARPALSAPGTVVKLVMHPSSSHDQAASSATAQTAPVIRVTIGRVDVRAVTSAAPPSSSSSSGARLTDARRGPSLSLEDYLRQREGGKR